MPRPRATSRHLWLALGALGLGFLWTGCHSKDAPAVPLPQRAYIWQRDWRAPIAASLAEGGELLHGVVVLAAEVEWRNGQPRPVRPAIEFPALKASHLPVSLALRVAPYPGPFSESGPITESLVRLAKELLAECTAAGVPPGELQLDFDCAQKKLSGYRHWVHVLRSAISPTPLVITTLPAWLSEAEFPALAREAQHYVLQVHSIISPRGEKYTSVCDPLLAQQWVAAASKMKVPFEIALPTYRNQAGYNSAGRIIGIASDSVRPIWPAGTRVQDFATDPTAMAGLVREWTTHRPDFCQGLLWYRLPVRTDQNNWRWPTLKAVMAGRIPESRWSLRINGQPPPVENVAINLADLTLHNDGETEIPPQVEIDLTWDAPGVRATVEALPGWSVATEGRTVRFVLQVEDKRTLPPGDERAMGWLRLEPAAPLHAKIIP